MRWYLKSRHCDPDHKGLKRLNFFPWRKVWDTIFYKLTHDSIQNFKETYKIMKYKISWSHFYTFILLFKFSIDSLSYFSVECAAGDAIKVGICYYIPGSVGYNKEMVECFFLFNLLNLYLNAVGSDSWVYFSLRNFLGSILQPTSFNINIYQK